MANALELKPIQTAFKAATQTVCKIANWASDKLLGSLWNPVATAATATTIAAASHQWGTHNYVISGAAAAIAAVAMPLATAFSAAVYGSEGAPVYRAMWKLTPFVAAVTFAAAYPMSAYQGADYRRADNAVAVAESECKNTVQQDCFRPLLKSPPSASLINATPALT